MPSSIDRRIVEMQFDNSNFERNIGQSMKSLDTFKQQLDFTGYEKSFIDLEKIANQVSFDNLTDSLNYLESRFSNIGIIGMTVVQNLTTTAMRNISKITSSITGMAKTGGINRALNIENAKFQLEGLGVAWNDIEDDINYGVKDTAYGLDEAAKAASQLVASQVELGDEMKQSLRGISGVAAMTNSSYSDIAHIFTTVAGNGRLMTMQLQQLSYKGLNAASTLAKALNTTEANVREMTTKGEIDFQTFAKAMDDAFGEHAKDANKTFTGAMSNMRAAFARLGAKVAAPIMENIRKMTVNLIDVINDVSKAVDPLINEFNDFFDSIRRGVNSVLTDSDFAITYRNYIEAIRYAFYDLLMIIDPIREAFREIFPKKGLSDAKRFSERLKEFAKTFYITRENADKLKRTFKGLFSIIDIIGQAFSALFRTIFGGRDSIFDLGSALLDLTADFGDYITRIDNVIKATDYFGNLFGNLKKKIEPFYYFFKGLIITIKRDLSNLKFDGFENFLSKLRSSSDDMSTLQIIVEGVKALFTDLARGLSAVSPLISGIIQLFTNAINTMGNAIGTAFTGGGWDTFMALVNGSLFTGIIYTVERILSTINAVSWKSLGILDTIRKPFLSVRRAIDIFAEGLKYENMIKIAKAVGILTISLVALSLIDADRLETALTMVTACILELVGAFKLMTSIGKNGDGGSIISNFLNSIGDAAQSGSNALAISGFLITFSMGILMMASAVAKLAQFDMDSLQRGLLSVGALILAVTMAANSMGKNEGDIKIAATSMIGFAIGIGLLANTVTKLSSLNIDELKTGLGSVAGLILAVGLFVNKVDTESFKLSAVSMIGFAAGILILANAVSALSQIPYANGEILIGLGSVLLLITAIGSFITLVNPETFKLSAVSMIGFAAALTILANAAISIAALDLAQAATGVGAILALLLGFGLFINNVRPDSFLQVAAGMIVMAGAMRLLTPAIVALGQLNIEQVFVALAAFAGTLFIFGKGAEMLAPAIGVIMMFAQSLFLIGIGVGAAAAGIALLVNVIMALAASGAALTAGVTTLISTIAMALPQVMIMIAQAMITLMKTLVEGFAEILPPIGELIVEIANFIIANGPIIMDALAELVKYAIQILNELFPPLLDSVADALLVIIQKLSDIGVELGRIGAELILHLLDGINQMMPDIVNMAFNIIITLIDGLASALDANSGTLTEAMVHLLDALVNAISEILPRILDKGFEIVGNLAKGLLSGLGELWKAAADLVGELLKALGVDEKFVDAGVNLVKGFIDGIVSWAQNAIDAVVDLASNIVNKFCEVLKIHSPSEIMEWCGKMIDTGLGNGITDNKDLATNAAGVVGDAVVDTMETKVDDGIASLKDKMNKFDSYLERWKRNHENTIEAGRVQISGGKVIDKDANKDAFLIKKQQLQANRRAAGVNLDVKKSTEEVTDALDTETSALTGKGGGGRGGNTGATKKNTKAKEENAEANEKKTKSIGEESEALNEETEAAAENEEEIRALAEQIEVVTEAYNTSLDTIGRADKFKMVKKQAQVMSDFWSKGLKGDGAWKTVQDVYRAYKAIDNSALTTTKVFKKGVYAYKESGKYLKKYKDTLLTSAKEIEKKVLKTGNTLAKVTNGQAKMFYKNGNTVEKMTIRLTKRAKNLGKQFAEARAFATALSQENISEKVLNTEKIEDFVYPLRKIQDLFVSRGSMPKAVQDYLGTIRYKLLELNDSMNMLAKNVDGVGSTWKSNAQNTAYVQDAYLSLAASLYDGSEAANEYATEQARLEFLMEHGLATEEEVAEHRESYISRITKALVEYKNTLQETLQGSLDVWKEFDTKEEDAKTDFIKTIESQLAGYRQWGDMLMELSKRGLSFDIQKELTEAGVESFGKLKSLLSMTREELALFMVDYQQSQTAAERAANLAVAALANARTQATARAAAKSGKITQKQINESRKAAREIANNNKALARDQAIYHSMTKKQEQDYLKTLTKRQKAEYKAEKKAEKKLQKEREALAEQERARRAEIERIETVAASITSYDSLIDVLHKYTNDVGVINKVNEILKDTMDKVNKTFKDTGLSTEQFIFIAHKLGAEGDTLDNFLSSVSSTLDSVADSAVGANKELKSMFETLQQSTTENRLSTMFKNFASHTAATSQYATLLKILQQNGLSTEGVDYIIKQWSSDQAGTLDLMRQLVSGGAKEITEFNRYFVRQQQINDKAKAESIKALYESTKNYEQELYNAALARKQNADANVSKLMASEGAKTQEELAAIRHADSELERILTDFTFSERMAKRKTGERVSASSYVEAIMGTKAENAKKIAALNRLGIEAYGNSFNTYLNYAKKIEQYQEQVNKYRSKGISNLTSQERERYGQLMNSINNAYEAQERMNFSSAAKKQVEYILTLEKRIKYEEEARKAALDMAKAEQANATAAYNDAKARWDKYNAELAAAEQEAALAESYEENYISVTALARGYEQWTEALRKNASTAGVLKKAYERVKDTLGNVKSSVDIARSLFKDWEGISKSPIRELTIIEEGFLRLANAMSEGEKSAEEFTEAATQALKDYRNTLYDNIKGSISIFEEFTKATNKQAKSASAYLDNIQSNMNAIKEWNDAMVTLSKRGVSTEWLKMFAAEGVNSYEKVMAFVQATDKQIGELNQDMVDYQKYLETTTDTTLAAIASSMTDSAISVQEAMIRVFTSEGADRFKQAGYDSSMMIITGLKNGLTNAMPEIVESISESTSSSSVANTLGREVGQAINQGLVTAVSNSVSETVNAAIEKFKMAVDSVNSYAQEYLQQDYTVRIHVDASEMDAAVARMNAAISGINANAVSTSGVVSTSMANQNASNANSGAVLASPVTNNITYNQTNNSPKALSRTEIYRQTRNQLSTIESVVSSATG